MQRTRPYARARNTQHATRNTQHATRNTQHATRNTQHATRNTQHDLYWYKLTSWFIVISLLLPSSILTAPSYAYAQEGTTVDAAAPFSEAEAAVGLQPQYVPTFDPLPEPELVPIVPSVEPSVEVSAAVEETTIDPESLKAGIVTGVASVALPGDGSQIALGNLQLAIRRTDIQASSNQTPMEVTAEVLPSEVANQLSPIGFAFKLSTSGNEVETASGALPLEVNIDYSQIPIRHGGGFVQRMHLYRVSKCDAVFVCREVKELADVNDLDNRRMIVDLASVGTTIDAVETVESTGQDRVQIETATVAVTPTIQGQNQIFLPLVSSSDGTTDEVYYVVMGSAVYPNGNYTATPLTGVSQYDVSLQTGTAQSSYPIQIPPAAAGLAPQISLNYNSGAVDSLSSIRNSQGSWAGVGWDLETGYIQRRLDKCYYTDNLCKLIEFYTIVMNGVSSRLIPVTGSTTEFRVQNDMRWKVEKLNFGTNEAIGHPDKFKTYWRITTPDGTKYRFGGEFNPDDTTAGSNDQNSVFTVPVYDNPGCSQGGFLCDEAWQWNLDRVEDPNGNIINYYYNLEMNYYRDTGRTSYPYEEYVRAGTLDHIDYGMRKGSAYTTTIPTRVKFVVEDRCNGACPTMPDTPTDLGCVLNGYCLRYTPTFWTKKRLKYILPQVSSGVGSSNWTTVMTYTLNYSFPAVPGTQSELRMTLSSITPSTVAGSLPAVQYGYTTAFNNRMTTYATGWPFYVARMNVITTELGGVVTFNYGQSHLCDLVTLPDNVTTTPAPPRPQDCVKRYGVTTGLATNNTTQAKGHWNRWKVLSMTTSDNFSSNPSQTITYTYSTPTSHIDEDPLPPQDVNYIYRYYSDFRGSDVVTETLGDGTKIEHRFHRGLYLDGYTGALSDTTVSRSWVKLSDGSQRLDYNWYRGREVETRVLSITGTLLSRAVNNFVYTMTANYLSDDRYWAYFVATESTDQITPSSSGNKTVRTAYTYDAYGNVLRQIMHGDISTTSDDRTIQSTYAYSTTNGGYQVNRMSKQVLWSGALTTTNGTAGQEKSITEYLYDGSTTVGTAPTKGNLTASRSYSTTTAYNQVSTTYDGLGRPTVVTDARGKNTSTAYHSFYGYATTITNSLGHVSTSIVDPKWGVATQTTDANGKVTNLQYDSFGRLQKVWLPSELTTDPASLEFEYHPEARPAWVKTRTLQVKAGSTYLQSWSFVDGFGRELQSQSAVATGGRSVTSKKYNNMGQLLYASAPYANAGAPGSNYLGVSNWATVANYSQNYYDGLGRVVKSETRSASSVLWYSQAEYDGWLTRSIDANGRKIEQSADAFGKMVKVTEYNVGNVAYNTLYSYDLQGNLTRVTDTLSNSTVITYNLRGQKTEMLDPDMGLWKYEYDGNGNLTMQQDALNRKLYMSYDDLNRLTAKRKDTVAGTLIADYSYDASGQKGLLTRSRSFQSNGTTVDVEIQNVTYDARNRLLQQNTVVAGGGTFRMDTAYNEAGQKTSLTYPGGNAGSTGEVVTYGYNAIGQLTSVSGLAGIQYVSSASYNVQGQMTQMVNENGNGTNGLTRQMVYESNTLRLSTIKAGIASPFETLQKLTYQYDNVSNVTKITDTVNAGQVQSFGYDWLNRLTSASTNAVGVGQYNHTYTYDAIGNISNFAGNGFTYGDSKHKHAVTAAYGNSYQYDANGNQITRTIGVSVTSMVFDYENRLTQVRQGATVSATFVYDANGQRVKSTIGTVTTIYIGGIYEYQAGATTHYYEGNALRRTGYAADNGVKYLLQDHLKSSSSLINQNGTVNGDRNYFLPFGGKRGTTPFNGLTTKRFTGQYHEASLPGGEGLSYYGSRWYDPQLGRFLSADTIVPGPGNPQAFNRYSYVLNNALRYSDPTGHDPCDNGSKVCNSLNGGGNSSSNNSSLTYQPFCGTACQWQASAQSWVQQKESAIGQWIWGYIPQPVKSGIAATGQFVDDYTPQPVKDVVAYVFAPPPPGVEIGIVFFTPNFSSQVSAARTAQRLAAGAVVEGKTVAAVADGSMYTLSGWKDVSGFEQATKQAMQLADEMGYTFKQDIVRDRGVPGRYYASHAEAQMAALVPNQAIGVSERMCSQCKRFYGELAAYRGEAQVVADPYNVYIFNVNGSVKIISK